MGWFRVDSGKVGESRPVQGAVTDPEPGLVTAACKVGPGRAPGTGGVTGKRHLEKTVAALVIALDNDNRAL